MSVSRKRRFALTAFAATAAVSLAACSGGGSAPATPESGDAGSEGGAAGSGTITAAAAYETTNYDPSSTSSALAMGTNWQVMEGLYELDLHTYEPFKALAKDDDLVEVSDTEYEVTLRDDAKFSDGTPVTSADVVESYKRATAEGNLYVSMLDFIDDITAKDDTTVTISLSKPFGLVKERLTLIKIVPASSTQEEMTAMPVGTGPWKYDSIDEQKIHMSPNENYNGDFPAEDEAMVVDIIKDDTARTTALQEGSVQVMEAVPADVRAQLEGAGATVESVQGFALPFLMFNTKKAPFDDARVRQAFFYAIDVDKLISNAMSGEATAATSFLPATHANYNEASTVFTYDPEKAKELLKEAGVDSIDITLLTTDHPWITALAPQVKNDLDAVGINTTIQSEASSSLYANNTDVEDPQFDAVLAPGDPSVFGNDPDLLMNWWYGDNTWTHSRTQWFGSDGYNKLHELLDAAVASEGEAQQDSWNQAYDLLSEEVPLYPLFHRNMITGYHADQLNNFVPIGTTGLNFIGVSTK